MAKRSISLIIIGLVAGAVIGTLVGQFFGWVLPDGVVKDFFLTGINFDLAGMAGNESGVIVLNLVVVVLKFGFSMHFNFTSLIGLAVAYYFLRYFR